MTTNLGVYSYNYEFYTGTITQPDTLTIFVKPRQLGTSIEVCNLQAFSNCIDCLPIISSFTAIPRIVKSVGNIISELSQSTLSTNDPHLYECWNAIKNLLRAIIAFFPIVGNITLIIFDVCKLELSVRPKIEEALGNQQDIAGVAFDGRVIFTLPLHQLNLSTSSSDPSLTPERYLTHLKFLCTELLRRESERNSTATIQELFLRLHQGLSQRQI